MSGKMKKLQRVAEEEPVNTVKSSPPELCGIRRNLLPAGNAEGRVFQMDILRSACAEIIQCQIREYYRRRYGVFAAVVYVFHNCRARFRKLAFRNKVTKNHHSAHVKDNRNGGNHNPIPVVVIDRPNKAGKNWVNTHFDGAELLIHRQDCRRVLSLISSRNVGGIRNHGIGRGIWCWIFRMLRGILQGCKKILQARQKRRCRLSPGCGWRCRWGRG